MLNFFLIGMMGILIGGCSSLSDSEIIMRTNSEKRKPKSDYMPPTEQPIENHSRQETPIPIAPQVGIRIPLGK